MKRFPASAALEKLGKPPKTKGPAQSRYPFLDEIGVDRLCERVISGETLTNISRDIGVSLSSMLNWIDSDPARYSRFYYARTQSAISWDEKAEEAILKSTNQLDLAKARELATHYRWRAKSISPKDYGDKASFEHTGANGGPITTAKVDLTGLSDAELTTMQSLLTKSTAAKPVE